MQLRGAMALAVGMGCAALLLLALTAAPGRVALATIEIPSPSDQAEQVLISRYLTLRRSLIRLSPLVRPTWHLLQSLQICTPNLERQLERSPSRENLTYKNLNPTHPRFYAEQL